MNHPEVYHEPVMVQEVLEGLQIRKDGIYVDATYGGGGHTRAILERLGAGGKVIAFDQDESVRAHVMRDERLIFVPESFVYLKQFLRYYHAIPVDGILADLGVSSFQLDTPERGFSLRYDAPLTCVWTGAGNIPRPTCCAQPQRPSCIACWRLMVR